MSNPSSTRYLEDQLDSRDFGIVATVKDRYKLVYIIFFILGISTLLPYNFFIIASEYFDYKLRLISNDSALVANTTTELQKSFVNSVNVASNVTTMLTLVFITVYGYKISIRLRIYLGAVSIFILFSITTALVYVNTDEWQSKFFLITIITVAFINASAAVYGCAIYGYVSVLPPIYIQSVGMGQSCATIFASSAQILTLLFASNAEQSGFLYFIIACVYIFLSIGVFFLLERMEYVKYYRSGIDKLKTYGINDDSMPVDPDRINDVADETTSLIRNNTGTSSGNMANSSNVQKILFTFKKSWYFMFIIWFIYTSTYSVYPSVFSAVKPTSTADNEFTKVLFTPVMFLVFSISDLISRTLGGIFIIPVHQKKLISFLVFIRVALIPLVLLCNIKPRYTTGLTIFGDIPFFLISVFGGMGNGYTTTICLMHVPKLVHSSLSELASSMGQLSLMSGVVTGSLVALLITAVI